MNEAADVHVVRCVLFQSHPGSDRGVPKLADRGVCTLPLRRVCGAATTVKRKASVQATSTNLVVRGDMKLQLVSPFRLSRRACPVNVDRVSAEDIVA